VNASCIFCRIAAKEIPAAMVHETAELVAFADLNPQAPAHLLVVPKRHVASLDETVESDAALLGALMRGARHVARAAGLATGYRVVVNCGADGGQTVSHLHLHVLGGRPMSWPPG
jgi:histidine triad (HIT) family protein